MRRAREEYPHALTLLSAELSRVKRPAEEAETDARPRKRARVVEACVPPPPPPPPPPLNTPSASSAPSAPPPASTGARRKRSQRASVMDEDDEDTGPSSVPSQAARSENGEHDGVHPEEERPRLQRPAESLRRKCPLCFGGSRPRLERTESVLPPKRQFEH